MKIVIEAASLDELRKAFEEFFPELSGGLKVGDKIDVKIDNPNEMWILQLQPVYDRKIEAIKAVREYTSLGLREAKDVVEKGLEVVRGDEFKVLQAGQFFSSKGFACNTRKENR